MTTALRTDPLRNFKFLVQFASVPSQLGNQLGDLGFLSMSGLSVSTESIPYREGGWNTSPHKMPGQTDFSPVTFTSGVFASKPGADNWQKLMYSYQWGDGSLALGEEFRTDIIVRVLDHPVTTGPGAGNPAGGNLLPATRVAFRLYNAWIQSLAFNDLNAGDNSLMIQQMSLVHEGFTTKWGTDAATSWTI